MQLLSTSSILSFSAYRWIIVVLASVKLRKRSMSRNRWGRSGLGSGASATTASGESKKAESRGLKDGSMVSKNGTGGASSYPPARVFLHTTSMPRSRARTTERADWNAVLATPRVAMRPQWQFNSRHDRRVLADPWAPASVRMTMAPTTQLDSDWY